MIDMIRQNHGRHYAFKHLPDHLFQSNKWKKLVLLFDEAGFLAKKANVLKTLSLSEDLEMYLLPALKAEPDSSLRWVKKFPMPGCSLI